MPRISIIIPAYNEEASLGDVIKRTRKVLFDLNVPWEIVVVDDGSTDQTFSVAKKNGVRLLRNYDNYGKGYGLCKGISYCRGDVIVTMDADGSHQPEELPRLILPILRNRTDVVIGSRFKGFIEDGAISRINLIGNTLLNMFVRLLTGKRLTDTMSGFRALERKTLLDLNMESKGYEIESEMTVELIKRGYAIEEVPIRCNKPARVSGLNSFKDGYRILRTILKTRFKRL